MVSQNELKDLKMDRIRNYRLGIFFFIGRTWNRSLSLGENLHIDKPFCNGKNGDDGNEYSHKEDGVHVVIEEIGRVNIGIREVGADL